MRLRRRGRLKKDGARFQAIEIVRQFVNQLPIILAARKKTFADGAKNGFPMKKMTRRGLLRAAAVAAAGSGLASKSILNALTQPMDRASGIHFGVQLNAFPIDPKNFDTFLSTLGQVKDIGYQGFESSFRNVMPQFASPEQARHGIEATGLTFFGVHIFLPERMYDPATKIAPASMYESVARGGAALGAKHLILSGLPVSNEDDLKRKVEALNAAGAFAKTVGITAAYPNHWPEFQSNIGGRSEIENLYAMTDPSVFSFVHCLPSARLLRMADWFRWDKARFQSTRWPTPSNKSDGRVGWKTNSAKIFPRLERKLFCQPTKQ
jgi:hypothetical protein